MRIFIALLVSALAIAEAQAQMGGTDKGGYRQPMSGRNQEPGKGPAPKAKADEKAYQDALKRVPDKPYDPWQVAR